MKYKMLMSFTKYHWVIWHNRHYHRNCYYYYMEHHAIDANHHYVQIWHTDRKGYSKKTEVHEGNQTMLEADPRARGIISACPRWVEVSASSTIRFLQVGQLAFTLSHSSTHYINKQWVNKIDHNKDITFSDLQLTCWWNMCWHRNDRIESPNAISLKQIGQVLSSPLAKCSGPTVITGNVSIAAWDAPYKWS